MVDISATSSVSLFIDYKIWALTFVILGILFAIIFWLIYKNTSKEFHEFTQKRLIADIIIFSFGIFFNIFNFLTTNQFSLLFKDTNYPLIGFFIFAILVNLVIGFYTIHLFVCSITCIFQTIKNKSFKKDKKNFTISSVYVLLFNGIVTSITFFILFIFLSTFFAEISLQSSVPCGLEITGFNSPSPALSAGMKLNEIVVRIDENDVLKSEDLRNILSSKNPNDQISISTNKKTYNVTLGTDPKNKSKPHLGILATQSLCAK